MTRLKIRLFTITLLLTLTTLKAQEIPNGSFESWGYVKVGTYIIHNPGYWYYSQNLYNVLDNNQESTIQTNDAYEGQSAVELLNVKNNYNQPAYIGIPPFKVDGKPSFLNGFYKYDCKGDDKFSIIITMYKDSKIIGGGKYVSGVITYGYLPFSVPITYLTTSLPDSANIYMYAGKESPYSLGSDLKIDALSLGSSSGISEVPSTPLVTISPNPANEKINITFEQLQNGPIHIAIYDILGNEKEIITSSDSYAKGMHTLSWNRTNLPSGVYFIKTIQASGKKIDKVILQ